MDDGDCITLIIAAATAQSSICAVKLCPEKYSWNMWIVIKHLLVQCKLNNCPSYSCSPSIDYVKVNVYVYSPDFPSRYPMSSADCTMFVVFICLFMYTASVILNRENQWLVLLFYDKQSKEGHKVWHCPQQTRVLQVQSTNACIGRLPSLLHMQRVWASDRRLQSWPSQQWRCQQRAMEENKKEH